MYKLIEFDLHAPSEHTFDGENYDVELQLIHQDYTGSTYAIVSIFFDVVDGGNNVNSFIDSLNLAVANSTVPLIPMQKLYHMVDSKKIYHYTGSLTTPPCTEDVSWWIFPEPIHISSQQLATINAQWKNK